MMRSRSIPALLATAALVASLAAGCEGNLLTAARASKALADAPPRERVAKPQFSPGAGSYDRDISVVLSCSTDGAAIHYTTDGATAPSALSPTFDPAKPIRVAGDGTTMSIAAIAMKAGMDDSESSGASFTINGSKVSTPYATPGGGSYSADQLVSLRCMTPDAVIHYTIDGLTIPTAGSPVFSSPIPVAGDRTSMVIMALATKAGMADSDMISASYAIAYPLALPPTFDLAPGSYDRDISVGLSCGTSGATVYYTTDGSDPALASSTRRIYSTAIDVSGDGTSRTIAAIAVKAGMGNSYPTSGLFAVNLARVSTPQFMPAPGRYDEDQAVTLYTSTLNADIYYTISTDGSVPAEPSAASTRYLGAIPVGGNGATAWVKALATKVGMKASTVVSGSYAITYPGTITVSLTAPSASSVIFTGNPTSVVRGAAMAVSTSFMASSYAWYLDYSSIPASMAPSFAVPTSSLGFGLHDIALITVKDGVSYSGSFRFSITSH